MNMLELLAILWVVRLVTGSKIVGCLADILTVVFILTWIGIQL